VTFTPTASGNRSAAVSVTDNAPGSPQALPLSGVGVLPAVSLSATTLNFGNQTAGSASSPQTITLTDTGTGALTITSVAITGANSNQFSQTNNCSSPVSSCAINVTFVPTALGNASASLSITDNAPGSPQSVPLTGVGVSGVALSPTSITFPSQYVGTSGLPQDVTLTNTGDTMLTISNVTATPTTYFSALSSCGNSLAAGGNCSIGVFFDPSTSGTSTGVLTVTDSATSSPQTVSLSGAGQDFSFAPSGSSTASVSPGQAAKYTIAVAPGGGFKESVALSCSGAPAQSTCSLSPSSVALNGSSVASVTVMVTTAGNSASLSDQPFYPTDNRSLAMWFGLSGFAGLVLLGGSIHRSRKGMSGMLRLAALLCLLSLGMTWSACGSGSGGGHGNGGGTPSGTYILLVTGTFTSGSTTLDSQHEADLGCAVIFGSKRQALTRS
jgi:hypothetical protein